MPIRNVVLVFSVLAVTLVLDSVAPARADVVNINSRSNSEANPVVIFLEAGTYAVTPIGTDDGGVFNAWSAWRSTTCSNANGCQRTSPTTFTGWVNAYAILSPEITAVTVDGLDVPPVDDSTGLFTFFLSTPAVTKYRADDGFVYPAAIGALANALPSTFTLSESDSVGFAIIDGATLLGDNRGGISLDVILISDELIVTVDIKPGSFPNSVNPSGSRGVIPVAILTTDQFDATTVNPLSVAFGPDGAAVSHGSGHVEDVDDDGDLDLVLHFRTQDTGIQCGDTSASLKGSTFDGQAIEGSDSINTVRCKSQASDRH